MAVVDGLEIGARVDEREAVGRDVEGCRVGNVETVGRDVGGRSVGMAVVGGVEGTGLNVGDLVCCTRLFRVNIPAIVNDPSQRLPISLTLMSRSHDASVHQNMFIPTAALSWLTLSSQLLATSVPPLVENAADAKM